MQIHELNNFTGTLGAGSYVAMDDGNDTGKLSHAAFLAPVNARIDNIIAGEAPSAEEIVDARLGDDGVVYPSLGDAIRDQFSDVKSALNVETDSIYRGENGIQVFDIGKAVDGYYPAPSGTNAGKLIANAGAFTTAFMYIKPMEKAVVTHYFTGTHSTCFYNNDGSFAYGSADAFTSGVPKEFNINYRTYPNVAYMRCGADLTEKSQFSVVGHPLEHFASVNDLTNIKNDKPSYNAVGFNVWDEKWERGSIDNTTGEPTDPSANTIRSVNFIPIFGGVEYFLCAPVGAHLYYYDAQKAFISKTASTSTFTPPSTARFLKFRMYPGDYGTVYNNDICINISQPNTSFDPHNGQYFPYVYYGNYRDIVENRKLIYANKDAITNNSVGVDLQFLVSSEYDSGYSPIGALSPFVPGYMAFTNPPKIVYSEYITTNKNVMLFKKATTLIVDSAFQTMVFYYNTSTQQYEWTESWSAGNKTIPANQPFGMSIRRGTGETKESIPTLVDAITFKNELAYLNDKVAHLYSGGEAYYGEGMPFGKRYYNIEHYMDMDYEPSTYIEDGACFGKYYFQFSEDAKTVGVVDMESKEVIYTWQNPNVHGHCNAVSFGNEYYASDDEFPLIYTSDSTTRSVRVYRITRSGNTFNFTTVQYIALQSAEITGLYVANCVVDAENSRLIIMGADTDDPEHNTNTKMYIKVHELPKLSDGYDVSIFDADALYSFKVDLINYAFQGAFVRDGKIYHLFGFYSNKHIVVIDLNLKSIVTTLDFSANKMPIVASEPEAIFTCENELYIVAQNLKIYKFNFQLR